ncbi:MAG: hypothetical protein EA405_10135 [Rhodospirillales bacterium]|nr:MAG: hypothetical protein EA405_10135 [Rhodospirillales bacterium]
MDQDKNGPGGWQPRCQAPVLCDVQEDAVDDDDNTTQPEVGTDAPKPPRRRKAPARKRKATEARSPTAAAATAESDAEPAPGFVPAETATMPSRPQPPLARRIGRMFGVTLALGSVAVLAGWMLRR